MKNLTMGIHFADEDGKIYSKKQVSVNWTIDVEQDLMKNHSIFVQDEIANILTEQFKSQLTTDVIKEMLDELKGEAE